MSLEDRKDLLGHKSNTSITSHYSAASLQNLYIAANKVCEQNEDRMLLKSLRESRKKMSSDEGIGEQANQVFCVTNNILDPSSHGSCILTLDHISG